MKKEIVRCLFEGRHPITNNPEPIYQDFDFKEFKPIAKKRLLRDKSLPSFKEIDEDNYILYLLGKDDLTLKLYVTGLTPALTYFLSKFRRLGAGKIILLHYNRERDTYIEQEF